MCSRVALQEPEMLINRQYVYHLITKSSKESSCYYVATSCLMHNPSFHFCTGHLCLYHRCNTQQPLPIHSFSLHKQQFVTNAAKTEWINASEGTDRVQKFTRPCCYRWVLLFSPEQEACILSPAQLPLRQNSSVACLFL